MLIFIFYSFSATSNEATKENDISLIEPDALLYFAHINKKFNDVVITNRYPEQLIVYDNLSEDYFLNIKTETFKLYDSYHNEYVVRIPKKLAIKIIGTNNNIERIKIFNNNKYRLSELINEYKINTGRLISKKDLFDYWKKNTSEDGLNKKKRFKIVSKHMRSSEIFNIDATFYTQNAASNAAISKCILGNEGKKNPKECYIYSINGKVQPEAIKISQKLIKEKQEKLNLNNIKPLAKESKDQVRTQRESIEDQKTKTKNLEKIYGKECEGSSFSLFKKGFKKGTDEYENCLIAKNKKYLAEMQIQSEKTKILEEKLKNMNQLDRIHYQCENVFMFKKNSKKFKDCVLQVYISETEAEKIQLEKEVLLTKLESSKLKLKSRQLELEILNAKAKAEKIEKEKIEEAKKLAKLEAQKAAELEKQKNLIAKKEKNNAKGLGSFLDLISVGLQIYSLTSPTPSIGSGSSVSSAMQCFTSGMFQYCN